MLGQTLGGFGGYFNIPSADVLKDKEVSAGVNFTQKSGVNYWANTYDLISYNVTICFLPRFELLLRLNHLLNVGGNYTGDRMLGIRYQFITESEIIPGMLIGFQSPYSTGDDITKSHHFNSTYLVATKSISNIPVANKLKLTLGYGSDIIHADDYQFIGLFGGVSAQFNIDYNGNSYLEYIVEHDAERFNTGIRLKLFKHISLLGGYLGFKHFSGGASVNFTL